eukprot:GHVN01073163.1.p1 GENE.GHVN01073163.1~~GHVN01073163.1.p1  ORF type:complete len:1311 (+),score=202.00 GHVN01073163.1:2257-6189(+)
MHSFTSHSCGPPLLILCVGILSVPEQPGDLHMTIIIKEGRDLSFIRPHIEFEWRGVRYRTKTIKSKNPQWNEVFYLLYNPAKDNGEVTFVMRGLPGEGVCTMPLSELGVDTPVHDFMPFNTGCGFVSCWAGLSHKVEDGAALATALKTAQLAHFDTGGLVGSNLPSSPDGQMIVTIESGRDLEPAPKVLVHPYVEFQWRGQPHRTKALPKTSPVWSEQFRIPFHPTNDNEFPSIVFQVREKSDLGGSRSIGFCAVNIVKRVEKYLRTSVTENFKLKGDPGNGSIVISFSFIPNQNDPLFPRPAPIALVPDNNLAPSAEIKTVDVSRNTYEAHELTVDPDKGILNSFPGPVVLKFKIIEAKGLNDPRGPPAEGADDQKPSKPRTAYGLRTPFAPFVCYDWRGKQYHTVTPPTFPPWTPSKQHLKNGTVDAAVGTTPRRDTGGNLPVIGSGTHHPGLVDHVAVSTDQEGVKEIQTANGVEYGAAGSPTDLVETSSVGAYGDTVAASEETSDNIGAQVSLECNEEAAPEEMGAVSINECEQGAEVGAGKETHREWHELFDDTPEGRFVNVHPVWSEEFKIPFQNGLDKLKFNLRILNKVDKRVNDCIGGTVVDMSSLIACPFDKWYPLKDDDGDASGWVRVRFEGVKQLKIVNVRIVKRVVDKKDFPMRVPVAVPEGPDGQETAQSAEHEAVPEDPLVQERALSPEGGDRPTTNTLPPEVQPLMSEPESPTVVPAEPESAAETPEEERESASEVPKSAAEVPEGTPAIETREMPAVVDLKEAVLSELQPVEGVLSETERTAPPGDTEHKCPEQADAPDSQGTPITYPQIPQKFANTVDRYSHEIFEMSHATVAQPPQNFNWSELPSQRESSLSRGRHSSVATRSNKSGTTPQASAFVAPTAATGGTEGPPVDEPPVIEHPVVEPTVPEPPVPEVLETEAIPEDVVTRAFQVEHPAAEIIIDDVSLQSEAKFDKHADDVKIEERDETEEAMAEAPPLDVKEEVEQAIEEIVPSEVANSEQIETESVKTENAFFQFEQTPMLLNVQIVAATELATTSDAPPVLQFQWGDALYAAEDWNQPLALPYDPALSAMALSLNLHDAETEEKFGKTNVYITPEMSDASEVWYMLDDPQNPMRKSGRILVRSQIVESAMVDESLETGSLPDDSLAIANQNEFAVDVGATALDYPGVLRLRIISGEGLLTKTLQEGNPYVTFLWRGVQHSTTAQNGTSSPTWEEVFELEHDTIAGDPETLELVVMNQWDDDFMGAARISLHEDLSTEVSGWFELDGPEAKGQIGISLVKIALNGISLVNEEAS